MYVSNLGFQVNDEELKTLFNKFGEVTSAKVVMDRETGRSRGFGFVEMADTAAEEASVTRFLAFLVRITSVRRNCRPSFFSHSSVAKISCSWSLTIGLSRSPLVYV